MFGWKSYFEKIKAELETAERKKHALNGLLESGKISKETFDVFNAEIDAAIQEIEKQKLKLLEKMNNKARELENHIKILEKMLANFEIQRVGGEIDEESYKSGIEAVIAGIENAKNELKVITELINQLTNPITICKSTEQGIQEISTLHIEKIEIEEPKTTTHVEVIEQSSVDAQLQKVETTSINVETNEVTEAIQTSGDIETEAKSVETPLEQRIGEGTEAIYEEASGENEEKQQ
ncbi:MAG: CdvA-like protein [Candidatus Bathyarchaeia archaeon]